MKHLTALVALTAMVLVSVCDAKSSHNLTVGAHVWRDRSLQRLNVYEDWRWFRSVKKSVTLSGDGVSTISLIEAIDKTPDGKGAEATLIGGGPGFTWATLSFKSQTSNPINFTVEIYGK